MKKTSDSKNAVRIAVPENAGPVMKNIAGVLTRRVESRCDVKVITSGKASCTVELAIEPGIGNEGFRIGDGKDGAVRIIGNDERGVLYGVGKFLRDSRYDKDGFTPGAWRGTSTPKCPVRMIYMATHFMNFYEAAPIEKVIHYVQDLEAGVSPLN